MKWVVLAIVACLVPYTYLTLHYRKPGPAYAPYTDLRDRANTLRLLSGGFQRILLDASRPVDPSISLGTAATTTLPGGVPPALADKIVDPPRLAAAIGDVAASPNALVGSPYPIRFTCRLPDPRAQLGETYLYVRGAELFLLPGFEMLPGGLESRSTEITVSVSLPPQPLKFGLLHLTVVGAGSSKTWVVQVH